MTAWADVPERKAPIVAFEHMAAHHDQVCHVCWENAAVLDVNEGLFQPCWDCQRQGWELRQRQPRWWRRRRAFGVES